MDFYNSLTDSLNKFVSTSFKLKHVYFTYLKWQTNKLKQTSTNMFVQVAEYNKGGVKRSKTTRFVQGPFL
jgi:hypothetical protein